MAPPDAVSSKQVANYLGLIEHHAQRFAKLKVPLAEFDDLVQVGMIRVWLLQGYGIHPGEWGIINAMRDELRRCAALALRSAG